MKRVEIAQQLVQRLWTPGVRETGGLLFGHIENGTSIGVNAGNEVQTYRIQTFFHCKNISRRNDRYQSKDRDMLLGYKTARAMALDVIGTFHTHPENFDLAPSKVDRDNMHVPGWVYLIVGKNETKAYDAEANELEMVIHA